ncbi:hypothetical protein J6590_035199 [Homalodisca vitripennis]|nr:hypothetical protein J6590_035199 [Homalodisca vitripennis]
MAESSKSLLRNIIPVICKAIQDLGEANGSSVKSIVTYLRSNCSMSDVPGLGEVKAALKSAVDSQMIQITDAGRYKISSDCGCSRRQRRSCRRRSSRRRSSRRRGSRRRHSRRRHSRRRKSSRRSRVCSRRSRRRKGKRRSLCKPRGSSRRKSHRSKCRAPRRPCTRMWTPKNSGRRGGRCRTQDVSKNGDNQSIEMNQPDVKSEKTT